MEKESQEETFQVKPYWNSRSALTLKRLIQNFSDRKRPYWILERFDGKVLAGFSVESGNIYTDDGNLDKYRTAVKFIRAYEALKG